MQHSLVEVKKKCPEIICIAFKDGLFTTFYVTCHSSLILPPLLLSPSGLAWWYNSFSTKVKPVVCHLNYSLGRTLFAHPILLLLHPGELLGPHNFSYTSTVEYSCGEPSNWADWCEYKFRGPLFTGPSTLLFILSLAFAHPPEWLFHTFSSPHNLSDFYLIILSRLVAFPSN